MARNWISQRSRWLASICSVGTRSRRRRSPVAGASARGQDRRHRAELDFPSGALSRQHLFGRHQQPAAAIARRGCEFEIAEQPHQDQHRLDPPRAADALIDTKLLHPAHHQARNRIVRRPEEMLVKRHVADNEPAPIVDDRVEQPVAFVEPHDVSHRGPERRLEIGALADRRSGGLKILQRK